jgi:2-oxoglutarate ferredoxin oxidoreductase subunit delta
MTEKKLTLIESRCKGCGYCIEFCPNKVLVRSGKISEKGAEVPEIKYPEKCTGCNFCTMICPEFALVMKEESEDDEE